MPATLVFLSHIHEESKMASELQDSIYNEFSGFVDIFVSSDGRSIPAGANFLNKVEDGLLNCVGALFLISPMSVKRSWINFELGAVWIRNLQSKKSGGREIPAIPICHSGCQPSLLPMPLNNLNAISATRVPDIENVFRSIQSAAGGSGPFKTDFNVLSKRIASIEAEYTVGVHVKRMFSLLVNEFVNENVSHCLIQLCEKKPYDGNITISGFLEQAKINEIRELERGPLKGRVKLKVIQSMTDYGNSGVIHRGKIEITLPVSFVIDFKDELSTQK